MKTLPFLTKKFISENHIFLCKKENGIYWPDYVGRGCLDSWIIANGKEIEMRLNGITGVIKINNVRYVFDLKYENFRHHGGGDWIEEGKRGHHLYFDEVLTIYWKRRIPFPDEFTKVLRGNRFKEIQSVE